MYGLVALGYHITWATSRTMNFSQGQAVMAGAVVAYGLHVALGWPFLLTLLGTLVASALFGVVIERLAVRPFFRSASLAWLLATIACGTIAENVAMLTFGKDARAFPSALATRPVLIAGAGVYPQELLAPLLNVAPTMGTIIGLKAFAVAIIGGLDSAGGILIAGFLYGLIESFVAGYVSTGAREIVGFAVVIAMLVVRPWGLGGARPTRRV